MIEVPIGERLLLKSDPPEGGPKILEFCADPVFAKAIHFSHATSSDPLV